MSLGGGRPPRFWPSSWDAPLKGNADGARGIFGNAGRVWVTALRLDPPSKGLVPYFPVWWGGQQILFYTNEYLLTAHEHYERIPTKNFQEDFNALFKDLPDMEISEWIICPFDVEEENANLDNRRINYFNLLELLLIIQNGSVYINCHHSFNINKPVMLPNLRTVMDSSGIISTGVNTWQSDWLLTLYTYTNLSCVISSGPFAGPQQNLNQSWSEFFVHFERDRILLDEGKISK